jgi:hypothetical protein
MAAACSLETPQATVPIDTPGAGALMGVHFGDSFAEVQHRFPLASTQTSPHGAPAIRLEDVSSHAINYQDVIYEFSERSGMQMVIAHFDSSQSGEVYQQLQGSLGAPVTSGAAAEGAANVEASWPRSDGSGVFFSGPMHRVVVLGKDGGLLKVDIHLRDEQTPEVSSLGSSVGRGADAF